MAEALAKPEFTGHHAPTGVRPVTLWPRPRARTGLVAWLTTVDHKQIGLMYALFAGCFFLLGGLEALLIRTQLIVPNNHLIAAHFYSELFTMHGTTMIFLAVMPLNGAFFNLLVPLQIGARDVAFPRLNAFSLWVFVAGAIILNVGWFFQSGAPAAGWFGYAPLTSKFFTPDVSADLWTIGLEVLGVSSIVAALNFIVTIVNLRAPGMTMMRLPVFSWMTLITSFLLIMAMPSIAIALLEVIFDRHFGTNFFEVSGGGQPILWQHLFWIFGHPEVYILILPAMGYISEILPTFARKPLFGYPVMVFSGALIGFIGFGVWSHHMFTTGMGTVANSAFALATMAIAVPTGVKIFNWIGTLWGGHLRMRTPMLFALGFLWLFMLGGFSGIMHSAAPADSQQHNSYFVVAHFHYVLIGGSTFGLLAAILYWFPKFFGRLVNEFWGKVSFWVIFAGFNATFFPHALPRPQRHAPPHLDLRRRHGLERGQPRRHARRLPARTRHPDLRRDRRLELFPGRAGGVRPLGRPHARVEHPVTTARIQLRGPSDRARPRRLVAREAAPGGGGGRAGRPRARRGRARRHPSARPVLVPVDRRPRHAGRRTRLRALQPGRIAGRPRTRRRQHLPLGARRTGRLSRASGSGRRRRRTLSPVMNSR
jgi:cytochrome c oxidase subunit I